MKVRSWSYFAVCFAILMMLGTAFHHGLPLVMTPVDHMLDGLVGLNDPATFSTAAKDIASHGDLSPGNTWILHLWPPGFIALEAAILKVFGFDAPIVLIIQIFACALLGFTMLLQRDFMKPLLGGIGSSIAPFIVFIFPLARVFLVDPYGVIFGETFSVSCYLSGLLLVLRSIDTGRLIWACLGGFCFAIAAYFRSQYESLLMAATGAAILTILWQLAQAFRSFNEERRTNLLTVKSLVVCIVIAHALMLPWRIHNRGEFGSYGWVQTLDIIINNSLSSDKTLLAKRGGFVIAGGGNLACRLEPKYCDQSDHALFWKAFRDHMPEWYSIKSSMLPIFWDSSAKTTVLTPSGSLEHVENMMYLGCMLVIFPLLAVIRRNRYFAALLWSNVSFFGGFFVILSVAQFEPRYFYLVKLYSFTMAVMLAAVAWQQLKTRQSDGDPAFRRSEA